MPTIIATPGATNANSYLTLAEGQAYFLTRTAVAGWDDADDQSALLIWATRVISNALSGSRVFVAGSGNQVGYYRTGPRWTGNPATTTQALSWPRTGMLDRNGNAIASNVIPQDLKNATAELAGILGSRDVTADSDIATQGITSVRAGSVGVTFAEGVAAQMSRSLPQGVLAMLVPTWIADEVTQPMYGAEFDVI